MQPAPPPFVPSWIKLSTLVNELLWTIYSFKIRKSDDGYSIAGRYDTDDVFYEVCTTPYWEINSFEDLSEKRSNRHFILSEDLEAWTARVLNNPEEHRSELDVIPNSQYALPEIAAYKEFSGAFTERTKAALFSGYLPRHHLGLAIMFERYPKLLEFVPLFPVLLTYIAETLLHGQVDAKSYMKDLGTALEDGWRGLFGFCGFLPKKSTVTYIKNIILSRDPMGSEIEFDEPPSMEIYLGAFKDQALEELPHRLPVHESLLYQIRRIIGFTSNFPRWVNWQINQHQRIFPEGVASTHSIFGLMKRIQPSMKPLNIESEIKDLKENYIPFIDICEWSKCGPDDILSPETYQKLPAKEEQEREALFKSELTAEEQAQFRHLLKERDYTVIVALLHESVDYSEGMLRFLHTWNHEEVDRAMIGQVSLPADLIQFLLYRFPDEILSSPAYNFQCLKGHFIEQDEPTRKLLEHIQSDGAEEFSHPKAIDPFPLFRQVVQQFGHTEFGVAMASSKSIKLSSLLAKFLWRTPQGPVWEALLQNPHWEVRACLSMNPYAPSWVRTRLAHDPVQTVRILLAEQPWFMIHQAFDILKADKSHHVRSALAFNPSIPTACRRDNCSKPTV